MGKASVSVIGSHSILVLYFSGNHDAMESDGRVPHLIIFADGDIVNSEERHWRSSISRYVQIGFPQEKASEIS